jgi:hypothetical protein
LRTRENPEILHECENKEETLLTYSARKRVNTLSFIHLCFYEP